MVYGKKVAQTKCWSQRLADKPPHCIILEGPTAEVLRSGRHEQAERVALERRAREGPLALQGLERHLSVSTEAPSRKSDSQSSEVSPLPDRFAARRPSLRHCPHKVVEAEPATNAPRILQAELLRTRVQCGRSSGSTWRAQRIAGTPWRRCSRR